MERSEQRLIVRTAIWSAVLIGVLILGFSLGRVYQYAKTGYRYHVMDEKVIDFPIAPLRRRHAFKTVGLGFMDLDRSILTLDDEHIGEVTLYEAKHVFQESSPHVEEVFVNGDEIAWNDGRYEYQLTINLLASDDVPQAEK